MRAPSLGCGNTQPLTTSSFSVSELTKSSVDSRESAMSITMVMVTREAFLAERRAKTFWRMLNSGWFGLCLAKRGKYLNHSQHSNDNITTNNNENIYVLLRVVFGMYKVTFKALTWHFCTTNG